MIRNILARIRIRGSVSLTNRSGFPGSCSLCQWPLTHQHQIIVFLVIFLITFIILQREKVINMSEQKIFFFLHDGRIRIRIRTSDQRIRIREAQKLTDREPDPEHRKLVTFF